MPSPLEILKAKFGGVIPDVGQPLVPPDYLSTGILPLDWALCGGFPRGHVTMIHGPEGAGKSGLMVNPILEAIKCPAINGETLYLALEPKVNINLFHMMGIPPDKLHVVRSRPRDDSVDELDILSGDIAFDIIRESCGKFDLIVVDSIGSMSPAIAHLSEASKSKFALVARLLSDQLPLVTAILGATQTAMVIINQERASMSTYGAEFKAFGGYALLYHPALTLRLNRVGPQILDGKSVIGFTAQATTIKNSFGPQRRKAKWDIIYDEGVDQVRALFDHGREINVISRSNKIGDLNLNHPGERSGDDAVARLREEPDLYAVAYKLIVGSPEVE